MDFSFESFVMGSYDYDEATDSKTGVHLYNPKADIGGGNITVEDIDVLANYPNVDTVSIRG